MIFRIKRKISVYFFLALYSLIIIIYIFMVRFKVLAITNHTTPIHSYFNINVRNFDYAIYGNKTLKQYIDKSTKYEIHYNYIPSARHYHPLESVTLTTQGDFRFLKDLNELTHRWAGPISVALYAPGSDWQETKQVVAYLRNCAEGWLQIRQCVTFHLFAEKEHVNDSESYQDRFDCSSSYSMLGSTTFRLRNNLTYPINTARNIARRAAHTHFVFPIDLELFPSTNFIPTFMEMINANPQLIEDNIRNVFVFPVFELLQNVTQIPETKNELLDMIYNAQAFLFHERLCLPCHNFPRRSMWIQQRKKNSRLGISGYAKRVGAHFMWEPFYVGTNAEPWFDERFTWEGQSNKMIQAYSMCLLNYTFHVLDNAFLVHKPGIKPLKLQIENLNFRSYIYHINDILKPRLKVELQEEHGFNNKCYI